MSVPYHVLFLCTHNAGRSIMAECILDRVGAGRFVGHSAGSRPSGRINPDVRGLLESLNHPTADLRSKGWEAFAGPEAPALDFVITLCDQAAGESCPIWPGRPVTAHWPFPDPARAEGTDAERRAFVAEIYRGLRNRIEIFVELPLEALDRLTLARRVEAIGQMSQALA